MSRWWCILLLLAAVLSLGAGGAGPAAMVTDVIGRPVLVEAGNLRLLQRLEAGAQVRLGSGERLRLIYPSSGRRELLTGPATFAVAVAGARRMAGAGRVQVERERGSSVSTRFLQGERIAGLVLRGDITPQMAPAVEGRTRPSFSWKSLKPGPFRVTVHGAKGAVWSIETPQKQVAYAGPPLDQDRTYFWEVCPVGEPRSGTRFPFRLVGPETRRQFEEAQREARQMQERDRRDPTGPLLVMIAAENLTLLREALEAGAEALQLREDPALHRELARILRVLGDSAGARQHEDRAKAMEGQSARDEERD